MTRFNRSLKRFCKLSYSFMFFISIILCLYFINIKHALHTDLVPKKPSRPSKVNSSKLFESKLKYLLIWTRRDLTPFIYFGHGTEVFVNKKCKWKNCYVTNDRNFLGDYTEFDVIAFHGAELLQILTFGDIPVRRNLFQKYVFANIEAAANYPICTKVWNGFFNWTWTYKFNSDATWGYLAIRNSSNHVIGPKADMHWQKLEQMDEIDDELKDKLKTKRKPAAWFVSNCMTESLREKYVEDLQRHLHKFNLDVNIYGKCGRFGCPQEIMPRCLKTLENSYYFYLAFENAISEDYVTEKIVYALQHNTVPIVFGGANYTRYMPDGAYLNAYNMKPEMLAAKMYQIIKNRTAYYNFFRWKKYYSYHLRNESPDTDDYCQFCAMMNDEQLMKKTTIYEHMNKWWTGSHMERICHPTSNT